MHNDQDLLNDHSQRYVKLYGVILYPELRELRTLFVYIYVLVQF